MDSEKKKKLTLAVLGVLLLGAVVYAVMQSSGGGETVAPPPVAGAPAKPGVPAAKAQGPVEMEQVNIDVSALLRDVQKVDFDYAVSQIERDPMEPLVGAGLSAAAMVAGAVKAPVELLNMKVTGIVWDPYDPVASVRGDVGGGEMKNVVVRVGDVYANGVRVAAIEKLRVLFQVGDAIIPKELKEAEETSGKELAPQLRQSTLK